MGLFWPWALGFGLLALPLAVAIYWFRQHRPPRPIGSLLLWRRQPPSRQQGRRLERLHAPWLLALELLILALLALAAGGPRLDWASSRRPLVVVLDDSFSMRAGGDSSPRRQALDALLDEVGGGRRHGSVTLVLAGEESRLLAQDVPPEEVADRLVGWRCGAPGADLDGALARAQGLGGELARRLVLSDRPPTTEPAGGDLEWWSFGEPRSNLAVTAAVRSGAGSKAQVLVEVSNFASRDRNAELTVEVPAADGEPTVLAAEEFELEAEGIQRRRIVVPSEADLELTLRAVGSGRDPLSIDDRVWLPAPRDRPLAVALEVRSASAREAIERVLDATERVRWVESGAELLITDRPGEIEEPAPVEVEGSAEGGTPDPWRIELLAGEPASAYLGPFVLDHRHPLVEGLDLAGVVWAAGPSVTPLEDSDRVVIRVGDRPLVIDRGGTDSPRRLTVFFDPELSTLDRTADWPVLWWNLLGWRASERPGVRPTAARLGAPVSWVREDVAGPATWYRPEQPERHFDEPPLRIELAPEDVGLHRLTDGSGHRTFAVNALAPTESDLRATASGRWGAWQELAGDWGFRQRPGSWIPLLCALGLLGLHLALSSPRRAEDDSAKSRPTGRGVEA